VIHHPLHIDREADFTIDPSFVKRIRRTLYFPLFMQERVAPRLARIVTVSEASRHEIERYFKIPEKEIPVVYNGTDTELFRPIEGLPKEADLLFVGRTEDRKQGIGTMLEALSRLPEHVTLKIVDGRIPAHGLVPRLMRQFGLQGRVQIVDRMLTVPELVDEPKRRGDGRRHVGDPERSRGDRPHGTCCPRARRARLPMVDGRRAARRCLPGGGGCYSPSI
jgi:glycosyltransferase involved in cell wall biosynthesis